MPQTYVPRGRYFEEFQVGDVVVTSGRTVTEADVAMFAGLTGDYNQLHTDAEFARQGMFGQRVAHGLLGLSIALGLVTQLGSIEGTVLAFRELTWKFSLPIFFGDTIHVKATVSALKALPRLGGGSVTLDVQVINQQDKVVQRGEWVALIASKAE
jgi:acyl dehydratase